MLHYDISGPADGPVILFLHGFMGSAGDWAEVVANLSGCFRCLTVDLPGHGASTRRSAETYTMEGAVQALVALLDHRGIDTCRLVGYSMGGRLALYLALQHPGRCTRLVLESASPGLATEAARAARRAVDEERAQRLEQAGLDTFLADWYRQPLFASLWAHEGLVERIVQVRRRNDPHELARSLRGMGTGRQPALWERLPALSVATLALTGALDAKYVGLVRQMAERSRCVRGLVVPEAGHNVHAEHPRRYLRLLHTFLKQDAR